MIFGIMNSFESFYSQLSSIRGSRQAGVPVDLSEIGITEEYFEKISFSISIFERMHSKLLANKDAEYSLSDILKGNIGNPDDDLKLCIILDVYRCLTGLGHSTSIHTPEGFAFFMLLGRFFLPDIRLSFDTLSCVPSDFISLADLVPCLGQCLDTLESDDSELLISTFLENTDERQVVPYRKRLYSFCVSVSRIDGYVSEQEKEWLETILRLNDGNPDTDIISTIQI